MSIDLSHRPAQPATGIAMTPGYAATIGQMAYVWGWPLVNMVNRSSSITEAPQPALLNGVVPVAPQGRLAMLSDYIDPADARDMSQPVCWSRCRRYPGRRRSTRSSGYCSTAPSRTRTSQKMLTDTAVASERDVIAPFFAWAQNGLPAGNGWNRSTNNAQFGVDYFNRTGTAKSNMFDNRPTETQYFYTDDDTAGAGLQGSRSYRVTFPAGQEPPVDGFWSLTLYNDEHLFHANDLKRYSVGTKSKNLLRGGDGALTVYVGAKSPGPENESNWLPAPDGPFSLYIRAYWGQQPILDGSWKPPAVEPT